MPALTTSKVRQAAPPMPMLAEIRCPLVLAVPNQNHRRTEAQTSDAQNQLIPAAW